MTKFKLHRRQMRLSRIFAVLAVCASLSLTACGGDGVTDGNLSGNSTGNDSDDNSAAGYAQKRECI